jgi:putative transposase
MDIKIINGVVSAEHLHIFVSIPPYVAVSEFVKKAKGRSSRKIQQEFPELGKKYWGRHFWGRGYFSTTSGNVTDDIIDEYINTHVDAHESDNVSNFSLENSPGFQPK